MIRVVIAEDHLMVREGIRALLEMEGDIIILGEAGNGQEALDLAEKLKPDVIVMDIMMPRLNGIQAAERMREFKLSPRVVLLSMYLDTGLVHQALKSGVKGYVLKSSVSDELILSVRAAARYETYLSGIVSTIVIESAINPRMNPDDSSGNLSPREKEILKLIAEEHTSNEIAVMLFITEKTVEKHRSNLMAKLNARNLAGLVRAAVKFGLVDRET